MRITDNDLKIFKILYKVFWMPTELIALLIDEPVAYTNRRLIRMRANGYIGREVLAGSACNYLTRSGMNFLDLPHRNVRKPSLYQYEHQLGEAQMYCFLSMYPLTKAKKPLARFFEIITERDLLCCRDWEVVGYKSNGAKKMRAADEDFHVPDGYIRSTSGQLYGLEFERSRKSATSNTQLINNIHSNSLIFGTQLWFAEGKLVQNKIHREKGDNKILIYDMATVRAWLDTRIASLSETISWKEKRTPEDRLGDWTTPKPLNQLMENIDLQLE